MASPKRAPRPTPRPAPPRKPPSYPRRPLPRDPGRRPAPKRPRRPAPGRPRPGPSPFPYPQRPKVPKPYKPKPLPKFKPLPTPKYRPPPGWQRYRKFWRGPHRFIIDQFFPTDPWTWSPGPTPVWRIPPGWSVICGPTGQPNYGYGTGYEQYGACPGGSCIVSYIQTVEGTMNPYQGVSLTNLVSGQWRKQSVWIGAMNEAAAQGLPHGRMTRYMKICRNDTQPVPNPEWAIPRFPPIPLPEAPPAPVPEISPPPPVPRPRPMPQPRPRPRPQPQPYPWPQPHPLPFPTIPPFPGPLPQPVPVPRPGPGPVPGISPVPEGGPIFRLPPEPEIVTYPRPFPQPKPERHFPNPPGKEKRKIPYGGLEHWIYTLYKRAGNVYGGMTELKDMLDCLEKNMGSGKWPKLPLHERLQRAANYIQNNPRGVKWGSFLGCMAEENAKDWLIGKMNQLARQITNHPYYVRPVGPGTGGWASRNNTSIKMKDL